MEARTAGAVVANSIVILTDQNRVDAIGTFSTDPVAATRTPTLDQLATNGRSYSRAYTPTPICSPARASLLTGKYPFRHQVLANAEWNVGYSTELSKDSWTYSAELRRAGYNVGLVGKFHVGAVNLPSCFGIDDISFAGATNPADDPRYVSWLQQNGYPPVRVSEVIRGRLPGNRPGHVLAAKLEQPEEATFERFLTSLAIEKLRSYASRYTETGQPFTLDIHYFGPHLPYIIPERFWDAIDPSTISLPGSFRETFCNKPPVQKNYSRYWSSDSFSDDEWRKIIAIYHGYMYLIDSEIKLILDEVSNLGLADSTAIFFSADHGEFTGAHRLNDKGPMAYEDILRIPLIVRIPGVEQAKTSNELVSLLDIPATILDLAGLDCELVQDGRSLLELERPGATGRDSLLCEFHGHHFPLQQRVLITRQYKLVVSPESVNELYDLYNDPFELTNLYTLPLFDRVRVRLLRELYDMLVAREDSAFAKWMVATVEFGVPIDSFRGSPYANA